MQHGPASQASCPRAKMAGRHRRWNLKPRRALPPALLSYRRPVCLVAPASHTHKPGSVALALHN